MPMREDKKGVDSKKDVEKEHLMETPSESVQIEKLKEVQARHVSPPVKPYKPLVLYP